MAPQVMKEDWFGHTTKADVWSLAIMIYELLTGKFPFKYETETDPVTRDVKLNRLNFDEAEKIGTDPELMKILKWMLQKEEDKRPDIRDLLSHQFFLKLIFKQDEGYTERVESYENFVKKQEQGVTPFKAINYILALKRLSADPEDLVKKDTDDEYEFVKKVSVDYNSRGKCCDTYLVQSASDPNLKFIA